MTRRFPHYAVLAYVVVGGFTIVAALPGQEAPPHPSEPPAVALPPAPQGVEVLARGPVHEAFATPTTEPVATKPVAKAPPAPLEELPPSDKPEGNASWIGGYWAWDDERNDFLWVSGTWRTPPPGQSWVAGYWRADGQQWHWVPGFWTAVQKEMVAQPVTYLPEPPAVPHVASPGIAPTPESFYVPGHWVWHEAGYTAVGGERVWRGAGYVWVAGYWAQVQPGYVWVSAHYRWTPGGYIFIPGYWDLVLANRGMLYAPVVVDTAVVGPRFVFTPGYAVRHEIIVDAMFVRPAYCHYYFGDYYGPVYHQLGFESCVVYSRGHYDAIFVYERYSHRNDPRWETVQIDICMARHAGQAPRPPRTLLQQNILVQQNVTNVRNVTVVHNQVLVPPAQLAAARGIRTVPLDTAARVQAKQQAQAIQQVGLQRQQMEVKTATKLTQPRAAMLNLPATQAVTSAPATAAKPGSAATPHAAPVANNAIKPSTPTAAAHPQSATPTPPPGGPPAAANNAAHLQPATVAHPSAAIPGQPNTQGKSSFSARTAPPSPRPIHPALQPANGASPRPSPSQPSQQRPTPPQKKPDPPDKPPAANEQKPS